MPELPEVQTIINTLKKSGLLNKKITIINIFKPKLLKNNTPAQFQRFFIGEQFQNIERKGKFIIFSLTHQKTLVSHLRMEGKFFYEPLKSDIPKTHLRIEFIIHGNHALRYYDSRMFGTFHTFTNDEHQKAPFLRKLALDPLEHQFDWKYLKNSLSRVHKAIKTALLDQTLVSGIGNIYADEILFLSRVHPLTPTNKLTPKHYQNISKYSKQVLLKSLKHGGTTVSSYKWDANHSGEFQKMLLVHTKKNRPCPVCKTLIQKIKVNGRGTYFCPRCQRKVC